MTALPGTPAPALPGASPARPTTGPGAAPAASATASPKAGPGRRTVDAPTRMFHWLFALSFLGAYLTAESEHWRALHVTLGYSLAGLLVFRLVYGLVGPRQAGLGALWRKLAAAPAWLRSLPAALQTPRGLAAVNWRQGQNLLMAAAVVGLLLLAAPLTLSGWATYQELGGDWLEEVHEFMGNAFLAVVLVHLGLILGLSLLRRQNQARPMLTGRQAGTGPDLVQHNRAWLAALLLAAVLGFVAWQHSQAPRGLIPGLIPGQALAGQLSGAGHDDDDDD